MELQWSEAAWSDYLEWQERDKAKLRKVNRLVKEVMRGTPIGKAERLKHSPSGLCSARIDKENRLVYLEEDGVLRIVSCKGHYE